MEQDETMRKMQAQLRHAQKAVSSICPPPPAPPSVQNAVRKSELEHEAGGSLERESSLEAAGASVLGSHSALDWSMASSTGGGMASNSIHAHSRYSPYWSMGPALAHAHAHACQSSISTSLARV